MIENSKKMVIGLAKLTEIRAAILKKHDPVGTMQTMAVPQQTNS